MNNIETMARNAKRASKVLMLTPEDVKNRLILEVAARISSNKDMILQANFVDVIGAKEKGVDDAFIDRLTLTEDRLDELCSNLVTLTKLDDPVGKTEHFSTRPNGLEVTKMSVPLGVICMIYEARPNVTVEAALMCLKAGNAAILKGGKEAKNTNLAFAGIIRLTLAEFALPENLVTLVESTDREDLLTLMKQKDSIDLVIPRGGEGLVKFVSEHSLIPVIQHFKGVCHLYVDKYADFDKAINILINGKTQRTGVCNALECLLVHKDIADDFLPVAARVLESHGVKVNTCESAHKFFLSPTLLTPDSFGQEYLRKEIAIRTVPSLIEAITHIDQFGSNHTEVIITEDKDRANTFIKTVDASVCMVNASSRFSDGSQLGLGAEIGIATTKLHAYGPMGIESLVTQKFVVSGEGQVRGTGV
ncbi:glutamate-5-semialdehyde dehydrogenase [Psychrosphaera sp. B3R10]|uniref:Gamma-glutamyl phosphate reductase n=1 Tax=Psychrosphaera algicola TaxID=3023714 RepID=A0ABT5FHF7_9GAMM|nr:MULTISPECIES: glutamate-5-semialdehyde dehydrogenase [unclassified Psychrosphaera]MBU2882999.1 glutamate-5-semialdehyde dehydrogenase [Psychrosphaera sp. I2R16]MBU2991396.1 glutamate-5-semialdehyde dehydrogenase [Psychrosphaera sp. B3R10]MDC2890635.1 glutamate-5-semialdehyde dehydrogenase [Psychrosphaera sp. G1-22]MDO6720285.1 glutamate-5-semialdehyde dehydrogenase [Psychrosphaera sp. 1_MG-2023]